MRFRKKKNWEKEKDAEKINALKNIIKSDFLKVQN